MLFLMKILQSFSDLPLNDLTVKSIARSGTMMIVDLILNQPLPKWDKSYFFRLYNLLTFKILCNDQTGI